MRQRLGPFALIALLLATLAGCTSSKPQGSTREGVAAATKWLEYVDAKKFDEAWAMTSDEIRVGLWKERFASKLGHRRGGLGKEVSRVIKDQAFERDPEHETPGEYVKMHFATSFENGKRTEAVVVKKQPDGGWKLIRYSVEHE